MTTYMFSNGVELIELCKKENISIAEAMIRRELASGKRPRKQLLDEMRLDLKVMRESIHQGLRKHQKTVTGFMGGDSEKLMAFAESSNMGKDMAHIIASSMAVAEVNASMGKIVAAPTAGACGILPAVLIVCGEKHGFDDERICYGLFAAGAIGMIIAINASLSGSTGGCQAETGTAAAMAATALAEMCGADVATAIDSAAIALKNIMGLVCDPVAGLVECPCIKRNAIGAANAVLSSDLALAGIKSLIPFDEVVGAMKSVVKMMNIDLRETAKGGLAATPTAQRLTKQLSEHE